MATEKERKLQIEPVVQESVMHNARVSIIALVYSLHYLQSRNQMSLTDSAHAQVLATVRSLTSSLFGIAAGILGLESYAGFIYFILGTLFVSFLIWLLRIKASQGMSAGQQQPKQDASGRPKAELTPSIGTRGQSLYFENAVWELWMGGNELLGGLSSFVLTWTLFYGIVRP